MKRLLRLPSTWLGLPILLACGLTWFTYELPPDYLEGLLLLVVTAAAIVLLDVQAGVRIPDTAHFRARDAARVPRDHRGSASTGSAAVRGHRGAKQQRL